MELGGRFRSQMFATRKPQLVVRYYWNRQIHYRCFDAEDTDMPERYANYLRRNKHTTVTYRVERV